MAEVKIKHQKTWNAKKGEVDRKWYLIDADGVVLGRLCSTVAKLLRGKQNPQYTPHVDTGAFVVIINANKIKVTGNKTTDKTYYHHTGYPGGIKSISFEKQLAKDSRKIIMEAVKGMLPKGPLAKKMLTKCKVFTGTEHTHEAQKPEIISI